MILTPVTMTRTATLIAVSVCGHANNQVDTPFCTSGVTSIQIA
jgi:hypothetical protein